MKKIIIFQFCALLFFSCAENKKEIVASEIKPNIIIVYLDDLGYGDLSSYGATSFQTPHIDKLAKNGMRFTDAYASSATCTPSRYALLTGIYPWRNANARILPGTAPLIISTDQVTLPKIMKSKGYHTAVIGKWHLGLGTGNVNWNEEISPGPNEIGFDHSYILAATQDRVPTVYIENGKVDGLDLNDPIEVDYQNNFEGEPTGLENPELLTMKWHHGHNNSVVNGIPRIGFMKGGETAKWNDTTMADHFINKVKSYITAHKEQPFFLYYALQQPHVPRTPHPRFEGKSGLGPRGDAIVEADWCVGELMKTLKEEGILENTLIIFSSDNGPVLNDGYYDDAVEKNGTHRASGDLRGGKYSLFEAGTRVPFITYWKEKIRAGTSDALISQLDLMSSLSKLIDAELPATDSEDYLDVLLGNSKNGRKNIVLEATSRTALRSGNWVMIPPYKNAPPYNKYVDIELGSDKVYQLYNLNTDLGQKENLSEKNPEKLQEMRNIFESIRGKEY